MYEALIAAKKKEIEEHIEKLAKLSDELQDLSAKYYDLNLREYYLRAVATTESWEKQNKH